MAKREGKTKEKMRETAKHRDAFLVWYEQGRHFEQTRSKLEVTNPTLANWIKEFNWHDRADKLDAKAFEKLEEKLAREKANRTAEMIESHFKYGNSLIAVGGKYLVEKGVETGSQAISAIKSGVEIQRTAEGLATGRQEHSGAGGKDLVPQKFIVEIVTNDGNGTNDES